ncbi:PREDICTED: uncharacterized protein LOC106808270 [Priapulus caudatus]|uniref:Uncharacterized protein LOC106808270 n=1 Tax=Priapulus caudatus TaxID=37621 RepID=A0ABM1E2H1_PRICU|nr:PREDICTED: uncharacterized protein LOC106808270 [Priapulus caudatus]
MQQPCVDVPQPHAEIGAQALTDDDQCTHCGHLRRRSLQIITGKCTWTATYVVLHAGCIYYYDSEVAQKQIKSYSLFGYNRVERDQMQYRGREARHVMKIVPMFHEHFKSYRLAAASKLELQTWMLHIRNEIKRIHSQYAVDDMTTTVGSTEASTVSRSTQSVVNSVALPLPLRSVAHRSTDTEQQNIEFDELEESVYDTLDDAYLRPLELIWRDRRDDSREDSDDDSIGYDVLSMTTQPNQSGLRPALPPRRSPSPSSASEDIAKGYPTTSRPPWMMRPRADTNPFQDENLEGLYLTVVNSEEGATSATSGVHVTDPADTAWLPDKQEALPGAFHPIPRPRSGASCLSRKPPPIPTREEPRATVRTKRLPSELEEDSDIASRLSMALMSRQKQHRARPEGMSTIETSSEDSPVTDDLPISKDSLVSEDSPVSETQKQQCDDDDNTYETATYTMQDDTYEFYDAAYFPTDDKEDSTRTMQAIRQNGAFMVAEHPREAHRRLFL